MITQHLLQFSKDKCKISIVAYGNVEYRKSFTTHKCFIWNLDNSNKSKNSQLL